MQPLPKNIQNNQASTEEVAEINKAAVDKELEEAIELYTKAIENEKNIIDY